MFSQSGGGQYSSLTFDIALCFAFIVGFNLHQYNNNKSDCGATNCFEMRGHDVHFIYIELFGLQLDFCLWSLIQISSQ